MLHGNPAQTTLIHSGTSVCKRLHTQPDSWSSPMQVVDGVCWEVEVDDVIYAARKVQATCCQVCGHHDGRRSSISSSSRACRARWPAS